MCIKTPGFALICFNACYKVHISYFNKSEPNSEWLVKKWNTTLRRPFIGFGENTDFLSNF